MRTNETGRGVRRRGQSQTPETNFRDFFFPSPSPKFHAFSKHGSLELSLRQVCEWDLQGLCSRMTQDQPVLNPCGAEVPLCPSPSAPKPWPLADLATGCMLPEMACALQRATSALARSRPPPPTDASVIRSIKMHQMHRGPTSQGLCRTLRLQQGAKLKNSTWCRGR